MADAKRDNNSIPVLLAVSNVDGVTPVVLYADPATHRLLTSASAGALSTLSDVTITSVAQGDVLYYNGTKWVNLPAGTSGNFLKTQGAGANPVWAAATAGAAGSDTQVQFNDGGTALGGDAGLVYNKTTDTLTAAGPMRASAMHILDSDVSNYLKIITTSNLTVDRNFTIVPGDAARTLTMAGNINVAGDFITAGAFSLTLTATGATNVTLPTTGTLATLAGSEALTNKSINGLTITASTGTLTITNAKVLTISNTLTLAGTDGKTLTISNSLTLAGTDATTMTFPSTSAIIARTDAGQTFTGVNVFTSPKIITDISDTNGNEVFKITATATAVNELTIANAATGGNPQFSATGGDTDIGIDFLVKGAGKYNFKASASGPTEIRLFEDSDNGTNYVGIIAPASMAANRTLTLPDATDTLVGLATTDTLTNKTLTDAVNNVSAPGTTTVGYLGIPQNSKSAAYTTVMADAGKHILHPSTDNNARTFTIDSNANVAYPIGTVITFINQINTVTIAITTDTLTLAGSGSTGSRTLAANGIATAIKVGTTSWVINGTGLT